MNQTYTVYYRLDLNASEQHETFYTECAAYACAYELKKYLNVWHGPEYANTVRIEWTR